VQALFFTTEARRAQRKRGENPRERLPDTGNLADACRRCFHHRGTEDSEKARRKTSSGEGNGEGGERAEENIKMEGWDG
jgi:hypothetical protein